MTQPGVADPSHRRVALVLGAKLTPEGRATPALRRRAGYAAQLWHAQKVDQIVVSGGMAQAGISEAAAMAEQLRDTGVPENCILLEEKACNTWQNIQFSRALLPDGAEVVLITDRYHAPRAKLMARRQGLKAATDGPSDRGVAFNRKAKNRLREAAALLYFLMFGPRR